MSAQEARQKLINKYGAQWFFICEDCEGWTDVDIINQANLLDNE